MSALLAREAELERLHESLDRTLGGKATIAFVTGEAGSGKSALLAAFVEKARAANDDVVVALGVCDAQTGAADPYLPFREVLAQLTGGTAAEDAAATPVGEATQLARWAAVSARALVEHAPDLVDILVPGGAILTKLGTRAVERFPWARRLAEITSGRTDRSAAATRLDREHIFEQYTDLLRAIAREHPLVLVLDDLHWVDPASAGLLFHLARRLEDDRVLLVGAYRPDDVAIGRAGERHPIDPIVNELQRYHGDVFVRLGEEPVQGRLFVDALLEAEAAGLDGGFGDELFRHTGGHPLFTVELLRQLQESGGLVRGSDGTWLRSGAIDWSSLPARVEGVIGERAARLDARQREILAIAAVEGQEFSAEVVARVLAADPREIVRALSGDLEKRHRLVFARGVERSGGTRLAAYAFRHSLFQSWFYGTLDDVERVYAHESVGRALESIFAEHAERVAGRLARHFVEADQPVDAIRYLLLAGDQARASSANAEAAERYRHAASMLERAGDELDAALRREFAARIDEAQGVLAELAGEHDLATRHYGVALRALEPADDDEFSLLRARIARRSAKPLENQRRHPEAAERLELAERLLGAAEHDRREWGEEWLQIQLARVWVAYWRGQIDVMTRVIEAVAPAVQRWGGPRDRAAFHFCEALLGMRVDRYHTTDASLAASQAALEASRLGGQLSELALAEFGVGFMHMWRFELADAARFLEQAAANAQRAGDRTLESRPLLYRSVTARFAGDIETALEWAGRAEEVARKAELDEYVASVHAQRAWVALRRDDLDTARLEAEHAIGMWARLPYDYPLRFLALLPLMAVEVAHQRFEEARVHAGAMLPEPMARLREPAWSALARAAAPDDDESPLPDRVRAAIRAAQEVGYL